MSTGMIIITVACVAAFIIPFVWASKKKKGFSARVLKSLDKISKENNAKISQSDVYGRSGIAIDETNSLLFFCIYRDFQMNEYVLKIKDIVKCEEFSSSKTVGEGENQKSIKTREGITFTTTNKQASTVTWEFFNADYDPDFDKHDEMKTISKWVEIIGKLINNKK